MAIVDPTKTEGFRSCGKGDKVLACVGIDKRKNQKGNMQYEMHYVCVKDLAAPEGSAGDKGADHWDRFVLVDNALFRIGQAAKGFGCTTPFDTDDAEKISEIFCTGYVVAKVKGRVWDGEERFETQSWSPYTGAAEEDWEDLIAKGEANHAKLRASRAKGAAGGFGAGGTPKPKVKATDGVPGEDGVPENDDGVPF